MNDGIRISETTSRLHIFGINIIFSILFHLLNLWKVEAIMRVKKIHVSACPELISPSLIKGDISVT